MLDPINEKDQRCCAETYSYPHQCRKCQKSTHLTFCENTNGWELPDALEGAGHCASVGSSGPTSASWEPTMLTTCADRSRH